MTPTGEQNAYIQARRRCRVRQRENNRRMNRNSRNSGEYPEHR
jgi:hypothetical protein